jgi:hypothetical protein
MEHAQFGPLPEFRFGGLVRRFFKIGDYEVGDDSGIGAVGNDGGVRAGGDGYGGDGLVH